MANTGTTAPKQWNHVARNPGDITADGLRCMKFNSSSMTTKGNTYMREIKVQKGSMPHFGLMMKGEFVVANSHFKATYRWCLIHCLQTGDHNTKLDFFHSNDINDCKKRLVGVFGLNDPSKACFTQGWTLVTAPAEYCCEGFDHLLSCRFDMRKGTLISQKYDSKANCILASRFLLAIFQMKNPKDMIEESIQPIRGELLRNSDQPLDDFTGEDNGIGCESGWAFWDTLDTKKTNKGTYYLQMHKEARRRRKVCETEASFMHGVYSTFGRFFYPSVHVPKRTSPSSGSFSSEALIYDRSKASWSIHDKAYRIVFQKKEDEGVGGWKKYAWNKVKHPIQSFSDKWWKDIARSDNLEEIRSEFKRL